MNSLAILCLGVVLSVSFAKALHCDCHDDLGIYNPIYRPIRENLVGIVESSRPLLRYQPGYNRLEESVVASPGNVIAKSSLSPSIPSILGGGLGLISPSLGLSRSGLEQSVVASPGSVIAKSGLSPSISTLLPGAGLLPSLALPGTGLEQSVVASPGSIIAQSSLSSSIPRIQGAGVDLVSPLLALPRREYLSPIGAYAPRILLAPEELRLRSPELSLIDARVPIRSSVNVDVVHDVPRRYPLLSNVEYAPRQVVVNEKVKQPSIALKERETVYLGAEQKKSVLGNRCSSLLDTVDLRR